MRKRTFKIFSCALLIATLAHTTAAIAANDDAVTAAATQIANVLKWRMLSLDRELYSFHYESDYNQQLPQTQDQIFQRINGSGERFYNAEIYNGDQQGVGFYLAIDPSSSRDFGGRSPLLFVLPIKRGTRLINLKLPTKSAELAVIQPIWQSFGCQSSQVTETANFPQSFRNSSTFECRKIITTAFSQLGVEGILYQYTADNYASGCRDRDEAINLLSSQAMRRDGLGLFSNKVSVGGKTLARFVSQIYRAARPLFLDRFSALSGNTTDEVPASLSGLQVFDRAAQSWRKRNMLHCGPLWSLDAVSTDEFNIAGKMKQAYTDKESQDVILTWYAAYKAKFNPPWISNDLILKIRKIEELSYLASGFPSDMSKFDAWKKAADTLNDGNLKTEEERNRKAEQYLDESIAMPDAEKIKMIASLKTQIKDKIQPGIYGALLHIGDLGPSLIRIKLNDAIAKLGYPSIVTNELPMSLDQDYKKLLAANRQKVLGIYRECTALMNDSSTPAESIQAGPCGIRDWGKK